MSNLLFTEVPVEQQEIVAGGFGFFKKLDNDISVKVKELEIDKIFGGVNTAVNSGINKGQIAGDDIYNYNFYFGW
ncbi:hypothetical protein [Trichormus variabilis]|uniref:Uncharacterized protein n=1 Tax=Trichormus variabilis SAG 1403-4b TaxID=447716 RepID=A0A433UTE0_ANAVA|nr:hypothetical protein [Trichormus variabilis]MBD2627747.1 hypothetical protein [Trichormus variabilis FACHB-164]RUS97118.1 hypothetical protein DSM107003_18590 [Trichormus variabilis SAG 1403-4b]